MRKSYDVIVVGAGAAGIACCEQLHAKGIDFLLVEAKARIGGRVQAHLDRAFGIPLELGAEFIHGAPAYTLKWMEQLKIPFYDLQERHLFRKGKSLDDNLNDDLDFWSTTEKLMHRLKANRKSDRSVQEFLRQHQAFGAPAKALFCSFVEGYHAADISKMSEKGLASTEEDDADALNETRAFRSTQPYQHLLKGIFQTFASEANFRNRMRLERIQWTRGQVQLTCRKGAETTILRARKAVITLPLGVLKSDKITWDPVPRALSEFLNHTEMGHVQKIIFRFRQRFWEELSEKPISFLHLGPEAYFPTWWTLQPFRLPYLVAWQGGPKAQELSSMPEAKRIEMALDTLAELTLKSSAALTALLEESFTHNWSRDPYALGGYSYVGVGGLGKGRPCFNIEQTLFFAGEALDDTSGRGTVHGAFNTGVNAAKRVLNTIS